MLGPLLRHCLIKGPFRAAARPLYIFSNTDWSKVWNQFPGTKLSTQSQDAPCMQPSQAAYQDVLEASDPETEQILAKDMLIYRDFITESEENSLFDEVEPYLKRLRYEYDHWDDAIHGYRETERKHWKQDNKSILQRVRDLAFSPDDTILPYIHVLDLDKSGCVKAHIDSVRFCGTTLSGICLLSSSVMRLVHDKDKSRYGDVHLKRRSLYIVRDRARYEYTHEILPGEKSFFRGQAVPRDRRISVITRNEPRPDGGYS